MKVSIIGCGKMGKEIIEIFLDSDIKIAWIGRNKEREEEYKKFVAKKIKRLGRNNDWTQDQMNQRLEDITAFCDLEEIHGSNYVIETITEELEWKQKLFETIQDKVDNDCVLLTNTSSIPLDIVFSKVHNPKRCAGLHFLYPCKIINSVEINQYKMTEENTIAKIKDLLDVIHKDYIVLPENANMLFSKQILVLMSEAYNIYTEHRVSADYINQLVKKNLMMMGIFEILNSTGNKIVYNTVQHFCDSENKEFYQQFKNTICEIHSDYNDCTFDEYSTNNINPLNPLSENEKEQYMQYVLLRLKCVYINYITYAVTVLKVDRNDLIATNKDVLGIMQDPKAMVEEVGEETIVSILNDCFKKNKCQMYKKCDYSIWK